MQNDCPFFVKRRNATLENRLSSCSFPKGGDNGSKVTQIDKLRSKVKASTYKVFITSIVVSIHKRIRNNDLRHVLHFLSGVWVTIVFVPRRPFSFSLKEKGQSFS
jgi:hypothetical protein